MERLEINAVTGEAKVVQLSAQEISDAQERAAIESLKEQKTEVSAQRLFDILKGKGLVSDDDLK